jgi:hypothetical protein
MRRWLISAQLIMLPRAAWKRIETHFDIRKDFIRGSGNCLCALLNHVSWTVGLDPLPSVPSSAQAPPLIPVWWERADAEPRARQDLARYLTTELAGTHFGSMPPKDLRLPLRQECRLDHSDQISNSVGHRNLDGIWRSLKCWPSAQPRSSRARSTEGCSMKPGRTCREAFRNLIQVVALLLPYHLHRIRLSKRIHHHRITSEPCQF